LPGLPIRYAKFLLRRAAFDNAALRCSKMRRQFGRPISEFQAIRHKLVDMAVDLDAARLLNYRAAWMLARGQAAVRIANEAVQIHGGYGFIKDVKLCTIGEGTSEIQRLVVARQLLKSR
jgi:alkylation response protein AidB-like acyl-CoA dehydrogenase